MVLAGLFSKLNFLNRWTDAKAPGGAGVATVDIESAPAGIPAQDGADLEADEDMLEHLDEILLESADLLDFRVVLIIASLLARANGHLCRMDRDAGRGRRDRRRITYCLRRGHR